MDTSHIAEHAGAAGSFFASIFVVATLSMRTMIPLRVFGILTNVILIASAIPGHNYATLLLHSVLLPLNSYRLHQMLQLVRDVKKSVNSDLSMEWLKPFMSERKYRKGDILFKKDAAANEMFLTVTGEFLVTEIDVKLPPGRLMGELGFLSPNNRRTATVECTQDGHVLTITYEKLLEIYFQNPQFGYYFLVLTSNRLLENIARLEGIVAQNKIALQNAAAHGY